MEKQIQILPGSRYQFTANFYEMIEIAGEYAVHFYFHDGSEDKAPAVSVLIDKISMPGIIKSWEDHLKLIYAQQKEYKIPAYYPWEKNKKESIRVISQIRSNVWTFQRLNDISFINIVYLNPTIVEKANKDNKNIEASAYLEVNIGIGQCSNLLNQIQTVMGK